jgi:nucleoside-diphosphate-sugar epimerase
MTCGGGDEMSILVIGGTGFIGSRVTRRLAIRGEEVVCMDINPSGSSFADLGDKVKVMRGDVTQFDDVMRVMVETQPTRVINLSYLLGSDHAPHMAMRLNVLGMDNCFEAARLCGVQRVVYASLVAVNGQQHQYGERLVSEDDPTYGNNQYAMHKIFNEWQARDYIDKYGMSITGVRPANVTGPAGVKGTRGQPPPHRVAS